MEIRKLIESDYDQVIELYSLSGIIRTRLSGCLIRSDCFLFIDGRQPICFI